MEVNGHLHAFATQLLYAV